MNTKFNVTYLVKTTRNKNGEFFYYHNTKKYSKESVSNDLNEIFTDLFEQHRFDGIVGIEILDVERNIVDLQTDLEILLTSEAMNTSIDDLKEYLK